MLYRVLKRLIKKGQTAGLAEKLDVFFACGKITEEQYSELTSKLASQITG